METVVVNNNATSADAVLCLLPLYELLDDVSFYFHANTLLTSILCRKQHFFELVGAKIRFLVRIAK